MRAGRIRVICAALCLLSGQAFAQGAPRASHPSVSQQARADLSGAIKAFKAGNTDEALKRAMLAERAAGQDQPALFKALELQGAIHLRKKDAAGAENAYLKLVIASDQVQKYHSIGSFADFEAALKRDTEAGARPSPKALDAYLKLGRISHKMTKNRELAVRCFRVVHAHDHHAGEAEDALAALGAFPKDAAPSRATGKLQLRALAGYWMLSDLLTAIRGGSESIELTYNSASPCVGAGASYGLSAKLQLSVEACGLFGSGDITESDAALDYSPTGVTYIGALVSPGIHWTPLRAPLAIGLEIPVIIRQIDAPELPAGSDSVLDLPLFDFGGALAVRYGFGSLGITGKAGYSPAFSTLIFGGQISYQF